MIIRKRDTLFLIGGRWETATRRDFRNEQIQRIQYKEVGVSGSVCHNINRYDRMWH